MSAAAGRTASSCTLHGAGISRACARAGGGVLHAAAHHVRRATGGNGTSFKLTSTWTLPCETVTFGGASTHS